MKKYYSAIVVSIIAITALSACTPKSGSAKPRILTVISGSSIQKTIDRAKPGDLVLIEPGTYTGDIVVAKDDISIRGKDRNNVVIDGKFKQDNGITVAANGVRIENLTVQAFRTNGILIQGGYSSDDKSVISDDVLSRFHVSYVNALNNGLYGIYAFSSSDGEISNTYSRANADAGIYIGQCKPCSTIIHNNTAEFNGIGLQGANASQELAVYSNDFSGNRTGIQLISETQEHKSPQESVHIVSNLASNNNAEGAPTSTPRLFGFGIMIAGGQDNIVEKNKMHLNAQAGIALVENVDYLPQRNTFRNNESRDNGFPVGFDIAYIISGRPDVMSQGNCFEGNSFSSSSIDMIETVLPCKGSAPGPFPSRPFNAFTIPVAPLYSDIPVEVQTRKGMPGNLQKFPSRIKTFSMPDLSSLTLPE